jgi:choice-of-anchor A domain-containing protein
VKSPYTPANDGRKNSLLYQWVKATSGGGSTDACLEDDALCLVYLQTNITSQAVQRAQIALYYVLKDLAPTANNIYDSRTKTTVIVDFDASYLNNWQGYANATWTSIQSSVNGQPISNDWCAEGHQIVGVWQVPKGWPMSFLCQPVPGYPAWKPGISVPIHQQDRYACSGSLCNYDLNCRGADWLIGGGTGQAISCYHREDNQVAVLQKGSCTSIDYNFGSMPTLGSFFALPPGSYLTGYNMANYNANKKQVTYYYCSGATAPGSVGNAMNQDSVSGTPYPQKFGVWAFGDISGLRDVQGPVGAGGAVIANSFNINWSQSPAGIVASSLDLRNGTVSGSITWGVAETFSNVTYNAASNTKGAPVDFGASRTALQGMSTALSAFVANGATSTQYGNVVLKGVHPTLNVFSVSTAELKTTYSITIDVPATSTVIINVLGYDARIANAGITAKTSATKILWNFYQATSLYATAVGIPGSVLAPFANARLGGNINGTLIAETVLSTNEFHQYPFQSNWLVP